MWKVSVEWGRKEDGEREGREGKEEEQEREVGVLTAGVALEAPRMEVSAFVLVRHLLYVFATLLALCREKWGRGRGDGRMGGQERIVYILNQTRTTHIMWRPHTTPL